MENQKGKSFYLVFLLALGFTAYYAFSSYRGSIQMTEYDVAKVENEKSIKKLDSLISQIDEGKFSEQEINEWAKQREFVYNRRTVIANNKIIGSGIYHRRLIKLYIGLGLTILSFAVYQYLKRR